MKKQLTALILAGSTFSASLHAISAPGPSIPVIEQISRDSITRGKYTLIVFNNDAGFDPNTKKRMIETFFQVYPQEAKRFNNHTLKKVVFNIDPTYDGVAATANGEVRYNPKWLKDHPEDIDVVTHEVMHIVQDYGDRDPGCPGWLTEGIADYARYTYGVNNLKGNWKLPEYRASQHYTNAYRITARFLLWVEKNKNKKIVDKMDHAARTGTYTPELWVKLTGETVDQLWSDYTRDPAVSVQYR